MLNCQQLSCTFFLDLGKLLLKFANVFLDKQQQQRTKLVVMKYNFTLPKSRSWSTIRRWHTGHFLNCDAGEMHEASCFLYHPWVSAETIPHCNVSEWVDSLRNQLCVWQHHKETDKRGLLHTVNMALRSENTVHIKNLYIAKIFFLKKQIHNSSSSAHSPFPLTNLIYSISCFYCCYMAQCSLCCCNWRSFSANNIVRIVCKSSHGYSWPSPLKSNTNKQKSHVRKLEKRTDYTNTCYLYLQCKRFNSFLISTKGLA